jgi:hypothetical protein
MYRGKTKANYYSKLAAEKDVKTVVKALLKVYIESSAAMSFIPSTTQAQGLLSKYAFAVSSDSFVFSLTWCQRLLGWNHDGAQLSREASVHNWMKRQTLPVGTEFLFIWVEPHLPSRNVELLSTATSANWAEAKKWIFTALQEISQRATESSFEKSTRTCSSVIGTQVSPNVVTGTTELPPFVTASGEPSNYLSESAALKSKVAKLIAQLATQSRAPLKVRSTAETAF